MNRTAMNKESRRMIADIAEARGLTECEIKLPGCMRTFGLAPAHRKKRVYYQTVEELADENEWVAGCQHCHNLIEDSRPLTEETFNRLRP